MGSRLRTLRVLPLLLSSLLPGRPAGGAPRGEVVVSESFASARLSPRLEVPAGIWRTEAGNLRTIRGMEVMSTFSLKAAAGPDWSLSFAVKRFQVPDTDQHFGVIFRYDNGTSLRVYFRGKTVHYWDRSGDKTLEHTRLGSELGRPLGSGKDAAWSTLSFRSRGAYVRVDINGKPVGTIRREPARLQSTQFYVYHLDCAFDDIVLTRRVAALEPTPRPGSLEPAFQAAFDDSPLGRAGAEGAPVRPLAAANLSFVDGILGKAVRIDARPTAAGPPVLHYPAGEAFSGAAGTIMFWFRPQWDGKITDPERFPWYGLLQGFDEAGEMRLRVWQWHWLRADLPRGGGKNPFSLYNRCRGSWLKGDWHHVALVWNEAGWCKLYVDGIPYEQGLTGERYLPKREEADLTSIRSFSLGSNPRGGPLKPASGDFDQLRIYRSALSPAAITAEFRRGRPVDLVLERRFVPAGSPGELLLRVAPGGGLVVPAVVDTAPSFAPVELTCRLLSEETGQTVLERVFREETEVETVVSIAVPKLAAGAYRLVCSALSRGARWQQSFRVTAYDPPLSASATPEDLKTKQPTLAVDCGRDVPGLLASAETALKSLGGRRYREAGPKKADRFAFEIEFPPEQTRGNPVLLEVAWPDDKPRAMGLFMYPEATRRQHRDRLEGGIQSGDEYPVSGSMQTASYLFYPDRSRYLFEARTMVSGMPAAVASVTVRPLAGRLPLLNIDYPADMPHRMLGHLDEDQTFEILFRYEPGPDQAARHLGTLCYYLDYTGQELLSYPVLRYHALFYPAAGSSSGGGLRPPGWIDLFLQVFERRGKRLIAGVNLNTLPELYLFPDRTDRYLEQGVFLRDRDGDLVRSGKFGYVCNPVHPWVRSAFLKHIGTVLRRYGKRDAFGGIDLWFRPVWAFSSLAQGYDDFTVGRFAAETGTALPGGEGRGRYRSRYEFLTGPALDAWLAWRAAKTTELVAEIDRLATAVRADLPVYLSIPVAPWKNAEIVPTLASHVYRDFSIDVASLRKLRSVVLVPQRRPTAYRHAKHWDQSETRMDEVAYDRGQFDLFRFPGRSLSAGFLTYFESFNDSLKPEVYKSYFQNADVKAHGRHFLREFAFCLAALDTTRMLIGGQPLGTAGRDWETREFARAYCALPAVAFTDAEGPSDPVTVRYLRAPGGLFVYAVNTLGFALRVELRFSASAVGVDLSTGKKAGDGTDRLVVELDSYQLRSFRFGDGLSLLSYRVSVPDDVKQSYAERGAKVENAVRELAATGADVTGLARAVSALREAGSRGAYAEAHRLLFSSAVREIPKLLEAGARGYLKEQAKMAGNSTYAVNCGAGQHAFYRAASGTLFAPDREYEKGGYGHRGSYKSVIRPVAEIKNTPDPILYATEAYDLDGYSFTVKPGFYTVRLFLKVGYKPNAKPGVFVMNVDLEGKRVLDRADLFLLCDSDFDRATVREFRGVQVADGVLDIDFGYPPGGERTARLCNAIEVIPEGADVPPSRAQLVIDVRTPGEFRSGHIPGAINIPYDQIARGIAEFAKDKSRRIVVYCRSGRRSGIARKTLLEMGYTDVTNAGGYEAYRARLSQ